MTAAVGRSARAFFILVSIGLLAGACTGSDAPAPTTSPPSTAAPAPPTTRLEAPPSTTTSTTRPPPSTTTTTTLPPVALPSFDDDGDPIAVDPEVRIGRLDNGLAFYIRRNTAPGGRAQLRLAVRAGSVQEVDTQRGAAHYLEHMMFNGTERFPSNELVKVLSRFGAEFGPDINAYTSYEETVYELELATDDPSILESGFDVLFEWATAVALDPEEVELERGVLLEEWRLRDQGFWGRYRSGVIDVLLEGTPYEDRDPLADPDQLETTTPEGLRAFFDAWYRPDNMALVAVGDFEVDTVEQLIRDRFEPVPPALEPPAFPKPTTEVFDTPEYFVIADPEFPEAWSELNYPVPVEGDPATVGAVRTSTALDLAFAMITRRLRDDMLRGSTPFFDSGRAANDLVRAHRTTGLLAWAEPERLAETTAYLLAEIKRARIFGFSDDELERAVEAQRTRAQLEFEERATTQDREYAADYVEHFLGGSPIPDATAELELRESILDEMTADQVWQTFSATVDSTEPFVIIVSPEGSAGVIPDEDELAAIVERVAVSPVEAWSDPSIAIDTLMERPPTSAVFSRGFFSDTGIPQIELANGARIVMLQTEIRDDVVVFRARSPGGWAALPEGDVAEAIFSSVIATRSGISGVDQVSLERFLSDKIAFVSPFVGEVHEGLSGEAAVDDLEILFQLINLYMTEARFEEGARDLVIGEQLQTARNAHLDPSFAVSQALQEARYSGDPRFASPTVGDLETFDLARAEAIFVERFADPGDFVFVFAGDFAFDELEDLARRYIGSIRGGDADDGFFDSRPDPPQQTIERTVEAGTGELGRVTLRFTTETELDPELRVDIALLELIVQQRLTDRIREELSASYSPFASAVLVEEPVDTVEMTINVSADPSDLDAVAQAALAEIADLRDEGPTADELAIAQQQLLRDYELFSNEGLAAEILFYAEHPEELLSEILTRGERVVAATLGDIRDAARLVLPADRYIDVRLVPIGFDPGS